MEKIVITTMCALINQNEEVLLINREKSWKGWAFPGGCIEPSESISDCVKREIKEETGLTINRIAFKGITHFFNNDINERYLVFNFLSNDFYGDAKSSCPEGTLKWVSKKDFVNIKFAEGMDKRFDLFFEDNIKEMFVEWNNKDGYTKVEKTVY